MLLEGLRQSSGPAARHGWQWPAVHMAVELCGELTGRMCFHRVARYGWPQRRSISCIPARTVAMVPDEASCSDSLVAPMSVSNPTMPASICLCQHSSVQTSVFVQCCTSLQHTTHKLLMQVGWQVLWQLEQCTVYYKLAIDQQHIDIIITMKTQVEFSPQTSGGTSHQ